MTVGRGHYTMTFRGTRLARGAGAGAVSTRLNMQQTEKRHSSRRSRIGEVSRWALVILASVLVCLLAGWIISARTEKQYKARASIFVRGNSRAIALPSELSSLASMMQGPEPTSYAMALLESADFAREIVKKLSLLSGGRRRFTKVGTKVDFQATPASEPTPPTPGKPFLCAGTFRVLHNDQVGKMKLPAGRYSITVLNSSTMTCPTASYDFKYFLDTDYSGNLPSPWTTNVATKTFYRGSKDVGFSVKRVGS